MIELAHVPGTGLSPAPGRQQPRPRVVVVGGGIGGLVAGAALARAGMAVTVLEAQAYLGGCAGTFFRAGYRFDAGATVAVGFEPGGPMHELAAWLGVRFEAELAERIMTVHLPGDVALELPAARESWRALRRSVFGPRGDAFWRWQEHTAAHAWQLGGYPSVGLDAKHSLAAQLPDGAGLLERFVDGLLMITAQTTSKHTPALHGAAALDSLWRGVAHLRGGMGSIANTLGEAIHKHGGDIVMRRRAGRIVRERGVVVAVETEDGHGFAADHVVANVTPWDLRALLDPHEGPLPAALAELQRPARDSESAWGALVLHAGVDARAIDPAATLHHQVHLGGPVAGAGKAVLISVSPAWDPTRAPAGKRAVTITTHTRLDPWWDKLARDRNEYALSKATWQDRLLAAAERAIPGFRRALDVAWTGSPVTYAFYTGRADGWIGGIPPIGFTSALGPGLSMVGDAVFPGQSTLAVTLSSLRAVSSVLEQLGLEPQSQSSNAGSRRVAQAASLCGAPGSQR